MILESAEIEGEKMSNLVASMITCSQRLLVLASVVSLISCKPSRPSVEVELVAGREFQIAVTNASEEVLIVDDRLLGLSTESPVKVEVAHANRAIIPPCGHLDYVGTGSRLSVPPNEQVILSVQLTALTATRCLTSNERYLFRASLVSGDGVVSSAEWTPFLAVSLD